MKFLRHISLLLLLGAVLFGCGDHSTNGLKVTGDLLVNGPGVNGNVQANGRRVYAFRNVVAGNHYTVRTQIAPGGTLTGDIYENDQDCLNSGPTVTSLVSHGTYTNIHEASFTALSSGDYFIALSGIPKPEVDSLYFYDLRLLSSSATTSFATAPTGTIIAANTTTITAGYVHLYSGSTVTPPGTYTVNLTSASTTTMGNPQMFIYGDPSLSTESLLSSSYSASSQYMITTYATNTFSTVESPVNEISGLPFSAGGPFILIKGYTTIEYTLTVY